MEVSVCVMEIDFLVCVCVCEGVSDTDWIGLMTASQDCPHLHCIGTERKK